MGAVGSMGKSYCESKKGDAKLTSKFSLHTQILIISFSLPTLSSLTPIPILVGRGLSLPLPSNTPISILEEAILSSRRLCTPIQFSFSEICSTEAGNGRLDSVKAKMRNGANTDRIFGLESMVDLEISFSNTGGTPE